MKEDDMEMQKTVTEVKKVRTTAMRKTPRKPKIRPETAMKRVFGTLEWMGSPPQKYHDSSVVSYKKGEAEKFEASFWGCMQHSNGTVEYLVLRAYQQLRSEARQYSKGNFDRNTQLLQAKALNSLADHIAEGFCAWYPPMEAVAKVNG